MKPFLTILLLSLLMENCAAQDSTIVISSGEFNANYIIPLAKKDGWLFKMGHDTSWASSDINTDNWQKLNPAGLTAKMADPKGKLEGWFRLKIILDSSFTGMPLGIIQNVWAATDIYIDGKLVHSFGNTGINNQAYKEYNHIQKLPAPVHLAAQRNYLLAIHMVDYVDHFKGDLKSSETLPEFICLTSPGFIDANNKSVNRVFSVLFFILAIAAALTLLFWLLYFQNRREKHLLFIAATVTCICGAILVVTLNLSGLTSYDHHRFLNYTTGLFSFGIIITMPLTIAKIFRNRVPKLHWYFVVVSLAGSIISLFNPSGPIILFVVAPISFLICIYYLISSWKTLKGAKWAIVIGLIATLSLFILLIFFASILPRAEILIAIFLTFPLSLLVYVSIWFKETLRNVEQNANKVILVTEEKREILATQNILLEQQVTERTHELKQSLEHLKSTQSQLIQSEKMASLGELTAGIAHEIQNPLNFVNNFSEVNTELIEELQQGLKAGKIDDAISISNDIRDNEEKINHHGKRADAIVKGMLQHSRRSSGIKDPTDINALCDEYLRLSYHGLRAKDKSFNATMKTDFDDSIGNINIIPQDIGRVVLNLINNAFYAVDEKKKQAGENYEPTVTVSTKKLNDKVEIKVADNGNGIPQKVLDKIFQPFFTTKPTGQGTGLGLSLSYDIVKAHGGELKVETKEGKGSEFTIQLPIKSIA